MASSPRLLGSGGAPALREDISKVQPTLSIGRIVPHRLTQSPLCAASIGLGDRCQGEVSPRLGVCGIDEHRLAESVPCCRRVAQIVVRPSEIKPGARPSWMVIYRPTVRLNRFRDREAARVIVVGSSGGNTAPRGDVCHIIRERERIILGIGIAHNRTEDVARLRAVPQGLVDIRCQTAIAGICWFVGRWVQVLQGRVVVGGTAASIATVKEFRHTPCLLFRVLGRPREQSTDRARFGVRCVGAPPSPHRPPERRRRGVLGGVIGCGPPIGGGHVLKDIVVYKVLKVDVHIDAVVVMRAGQQTADRRIVGRDRTEPARWVERFVVAVDTIRVGGRMRLVCQRHVAKGWRPWGSV
mmetsp:Transcript_37132/g.97345  ORF Transcript_37132/g.97345 Transcript_37132/m.97345 type:complete len:354 (+) Transcript_37132:120-1181(+)